MGAPYKIWDEQILRVFVSKYAVLANLLFSFWVGLGIRRKWIKEENVLLLDDWKVQLAILYHVL